jgi:hypothetical protein
LNLKNMAWLSAHVVTAMDIFKLQNGSVAQSAEALATLKRKPRKTRIRSPIVINYQGYLSDSFLKSSLTISAKRRRFLSKINSL